jgi:hypothetical protein
MRTRRIIEPISLEENVVIEKSKSLFIFIEQRDFDELMSFDDFLIELILTEYEYIQAIQCTLKQPTIFLKRKISRVWNNNFSKDMSVMWNEKIDAQYVLNAYVVSLYYTLYMTKVDKSMTTVFRRIHKEHERSHIDAMKMIQTTIEQLTSSRSCKTIDNSSDPMKPKGIIVAYTEKDAYNAGGTTIHSAFFMPFNKSQFLPLIKEMLDTLSKIYEKLQLLFIDDAYLIGNRFLYSIDNQLRNIKHVHTKYFGNIDMIFCGDLYQAQPIQDSLIFEKPMVNIQIVMHDFWKDNTKCFELHTTMHQTDETFNAILNRMRTNNQTHDDLTYINSRCMRHAPIEPTFPSLFYMNRHVAMHNRYMLSLIPSDDIIINSIYLKEDNHGNVPRHEHTTTLHLQLVLKLDTLVEIYACNYVS